MCGDRNSDKISTTTRFGVRTTFQMPTLKPTGQVSETCTGLSYWELGSMFCITCFITQDINIIGIGERDISPLHTEEERDIHATHLKSFILVMFGHGGSQKRVLLPRRFIWWTVKHGEVGAITRQDA
eukprot:73935_1